VKGGPFLRRRLCCPPPASGTTRRSDCLTGPGGFGVGLIRQGWAPVAHRAGSPVVPVTLSHVTLLPRRVRPGPAGVVASPPSAFPLRSWGRHPQLLVTRLRLGFAARCNLRGCALPFREVCQGTQCFRLPVAPPSSYLGDTANSQGRTFTGKSHGIHGIQAET